MIKLVHLLEGKQQFAGEEVGQKPGDQVRGTDKAKTGGKDHPFKGRLVGEDTTLEDVLSKKYQDFKDLQAKEKAEKKEKEVDEEKQRLDPKCWDGYKKQGTKMKGGVRVNNCVPEGIEEDYVDLSHLYPNQSKKPSNPVQFAKQEIKKYCERDVCAPGELHRDILVGIAKQSGLPLKDILRIRDMMDPAMQKGVPESVRIGSNLPQSDTETFGLEKGRGYKINTPKDWKPGDRPRAMQQLIPTQDKKDHIRSRLGKHKSPVLPEQDVAEGFDEEHSPVTQAITRRIIIQRTDLLAKYGPEKVAAAIDDVADFVGDVDEIGSSDVSGWVRQVEQSLSGMGEAAPGLVKAAGGLALGGLAAAGAPAIVGILGPLLGIPMAAYGAYSAAKMGMKGVEKLWDMAAEKLGGDDKVEQYTNAKIAKLPPDQAQAAVQVVKQVAESRRSARAEQQLSELGATPPPAPAGTATAAPTTGNATPTAGSVSPDEQTALNKIQTNPAMKQQLDKLMTQATPGAANKPMELNPEQEDALEKIKANAGLKTQYDKIIKQANPQAKVWTSLN